ncbi:MAG: HWE histidine kinase domain-containing protein [Aureliella sp.]
MTLPSDNDPQYQLALDNCASEPVHIPGRVQSFCAVIGFDRSSDVISHVSENLGEITSLGGDILGKDFFDNIPRELAHEIRGALSLPTIAAQRERLGAFRLPEQSVDVAVHAAEESIIVEFEREDYPAERSTDAVSQVRKILGHVHAAGDTQKLMDSATQVLRQTTGFDRVMAYRFLSNFDGEVIAEKHAPGLSPYLGLRYPASDIPSQVRDAMVQMPFRCIADIRQPEPIVLAVADAAPLNLTRTHSKGVSPIHCEYLANMGVRATMNIPIIRDGQLWGLFALHHRRPKLLSPTQRTICELFGYLFSMELQQNLQRTSFSQRRRSASLIGHLEKEEVASRPLRDVLLELSADLQDLVDADGLALMEGVEQYTVDGEAVDSAVSTELIKRSSEDVFAVENLEQTLGREVRSSTGQVIGGALVIVLDRSQRLALLFYRNEEVSKVRWAGDPEKRIEFGPNGPRLHPRASFEEYIDSVRGQSRPWGENQIAAATELQGALLAVAFRGQSITAARWQRQQQYQDLLIGELNHRVKNTLALVRAIAKQTQTGVQSLQQYTLSFEHRIAALATAHDLIGGSGLQWAPLRNLLTAELKPYSGRELVAFDGPPVSLKSDVAPVFSLLIHELTSNAVKHGALSSETGQLHIRWTARDGGLQFTWTETVAGKLAPPTRTGFGLTLIRRAIPHECGGETELQFRPDGVEVQVWLPSDCVRFENADAALDVAQAVALPNKPLAAARALVVEDNIPIAMEVEAALADQGCRIVDTAGTLDDALQLVRNNTYTFALLDINLRRVSSYPVAEILLEDKVPFLFLSGYGRTEQVPESLKDVPVLAKPFDNDDLMAAIHKIRTEIGGQ